MEGADLRRGALAAAGCAGAVVLVLAAVAGPPRFSGSADPSALARSDRPLVSPTPTTAPPTPSPGDGAAGSGIDLSWLGTLLVWAVVLVLLALVGFVLVQVWQRRWRPPQLAPEVDFEVLPDLDATSRALQRDRARQDAALEEGSPGEGIVACWLLLGQAVAQAGVPRQPAETSTEHTVRILHALDLDPRAVAGLAALYREARFSEHVLGEDARAAAREALARLHDELARSTS